MDRKVCIAVLEDMSGGECRWIITKLSDKTAKVLLHEMETGGYEDLGHLVEDLYERATGISIENAGARL